MSVRTRLTRLEGKRAGLAVCPVCRGHGKEAVRVQWDPELLRLQLAEPAGPAAPPPELEGCPRCGRVRLTTIRVVYENRLPGAGGVRERGR